MWHSWEWVRELRKQRAGLEERMVALFEDMDDLIEAAEALADGAGDVEDTAAEGHAEDVGSEGHNST